MSGSDERKGTFYTFTELTKALAWPLIALIAMAVFSSPISSILLALPDILHNTKTVKFQGFELSLNEATVPQPTPEQSAVIAKMHRHDLELLLSTATLNVACDFDPHANSPAIAGRVNSLDDLIRLGLADHLDASQTPSVCGGRGGASVNELGKGVRSFFIGLIAAQFRNTSQD